MDQPGFQQAWGYSMPPSDQQGHLVAQHGDDPEGLSFPLPKWCEYDWNYMGCSPSATNVSSQTVPLVNPHPHSNPEPHSGLIRHWHAGYAASSSFGQSPGADLPLSADDVKRQFPANDQSFQQNLLPWSQPESTTELNFILTAYADTNYELFSGCEQALTAGAALGTQKSKPCVRCWALRKPVFLFI